MQNRSPLRLALALLALALPATVACSGGPESDREAEATDAIRKCPRGDPDCVAAPPRTGPATGGGGTTPGTAGTGSTGGTAGTVTENTCTNPQVVITRSTTGCPTVAATGGEWRGVVFGAPATRKCIYSWYSATGAAQTAQSRATLFATAEHVGAYCGRPDKPIAQVLCTPQTAAVVTATTKPAGALPPVVAPGTLAPATAVVANARVVGTARMIVTAPVPTSTSTVDPDPTPPPIPTPPGCTPAGLAGCDSCGSYVNSTVYVSLPAELTAYPTLELSLNGAFYAMPHTTNQQLYAVSVPSTTGVTDGSLVAIIARSY